MIRKIKMLFVLISAIFIGGVFTGAYFSDSVSMTNNIFTAGVWSVTPTATVTVTPPAAGEILISEVYYDPDSLHGGSSAEWVELYNAGPSAVDLDGWKLWDNFTSKTISGTNIIPASGYALIATDDNVWSNWSVPSGTLKISVGGLQLFNGLGNSGDRIVLFSPSNDEVDAVSWGSDTYAFTPSCPDIDNGHSLVRIPVSTDTNTNSDFDDLTNPTPGA